jgi:hypothetical protein
MMTTETATRSGRFGTRALRRGLAVLGVCAAVSFVPGCIVDAGGPGPVCDDGQIQVSWDLIESGQAVECAAGDEVDIGLDGVVTTFPCSDHAETTNAVLGGATHTLQFKLFDAAGDLLSQTTVMSIDVGCGQNVVAPSVDFRFSP